MKKRQQPRTMILLLCVLLLLQKQLTLPAAEASDPEVWGTSSSLSSSSLDDDDDDNNVVDHQPPQRRADSGSHPDRHVGRPQKEDIDASESVVEAVVLNLMEEDSTNNPQAATQQQRLDEEEKLWGSTAASSAARRTETGTATAGDSSVVEPPSTDEPDPTTQGMANDTNDILASESAGIPHKIKPENVLLVFSNSTTPSNKGTVAENNNNSNNKQRLWGSAAQESSSVDPQQHDKHNNDDDNIKETTSSTIHIPYVPGRHSNRTHDPDGRHGAGTTRIHPPDGFTLRARVYIDPNDKLTHFDDAPVTLPYYDCGAAGSTTAPLPIHEMYIRHSLSAPTSAYPFSEETLYPVLAVLLQGATLHVSSGDVLALHPGDVVLLEDGLKPGHVLRPLHGSTRQRAVTVLFLQLPQQHRHIGKEYLSIPTTTTTASSGSKSRRQRRAPGCPTDAPVAFSDTNENGAQTATNTATTESSSAPIFPYPSPTSSLFTSTHHRLRRFGLGLVALSVSTLAADFLGRVAPLWLAVGIGGTCFVLGTTYGITVGLESAIAAVELRHERSRLRQQQQQQRPSSSSDPSFDDVSRSSTDPQTTITTSTTAVNQDATTTLPEPGAQTL